MNRDEFEEQVSAAFLTLERTLDAEGEDMLALLDDGMPRFEDTAESYDAICDGAQALGWLMGVGYVMDKTVRELYDEFSVAGIADPKERA